MRTADAEYSFPVFHERFFFFCTLLFGFFFFYSFRIAETTRNMANFAMCARARSVFIIIIIKNSLPWRARETIRDEMAEPITLPTHSRQCQGKPHATLARPQTHTTYAFYTSFRIRLLRDSHFRFCSYPVGLGHTRRNNDISHSRFLGWSPSARERTTFSCWSEQ